MLDLAEPLSGTFRELIMDYFFASYELGEKAFEKDLFITGTLRKNKKEVLKDFLPNKSRPVYSSVTAYNGKFQLVSYVPNKNKVVLFLSTNPEVRGVDENSTEKETYINLHYNKNMGAVDNLDEATKEFSVARKTTRWPLRLFYDLIDIAVYNSFVLHCLRQKCWKTNRPERADFMQTLAMQMAYPYVQCR